MALIDRKVNDWSQAVSSLDDKPKMTAAALKAAFDSNSNQLKPAINGIIDDLTGSQGASNIGLTPIDGLSGSNVQAVLQAISLLIKSNDVDISNLKRLFTADGAALIGLQPINGISGSNLQQAIISLADTISKIDPYLGNPVAISQGGTGAKNSQNALYNLGAKPNDNLLDNWCFKNPVNQRNIQSNVIWAANSYGLDRWKNSYNANAIYWNNDGYIGMKPMENSIIEQYIQGKPYDNNRCTLSILTYDKKLYSVSGNVPFNLNKEVFKNLSVEYDASGNTRIRIWRDNTTPSEDIKISAVKLEFGDTQTLARQLNDGTWELLEKPNYATELEKCQKYYRNFSGVFNGYGVNNSIFLSVPGINDMAKLPKTTSVNGGVGYIAISGEAQRTINYSKAVIIYNGIGINDIGYTFSGYPIISTIFDWTITISCEPL